MAFGLLLLLPLPGLLTGWGLLNLKPWARVLGIVLSILNLINIPFGAALGIYGLWVLFNKDRPEFCISDNRWLSRTSRPPSGGASR